MIYALSISFLAKTDIACMHVIIPELCFCTESCKYGSINYRTGF